MLEVSATSCLLIFLPGAGFVSVNTPQQGCTIIGKFSKIPGDEFFHLAIVQAPFFRPVAQNVTPGRNPSIKDCGEWAVSPILFTHLMGKERARTQTQNQCSVAVKKLVPTAQTSQSQSIPSTLWCLQLITHI